MTDEKKVRLALISLIAALRHGPMAADIFGLTFGNKTWRQVSGRLLLMIDWSSRCRTLRQLSPAHAWNLEKPSALQLPRSAVLLQLDTHPCGPCPDAGWVHPHMGRWMPGRRTRLDSLHSREV